MGRKNGNKGQKDQKGQKFGIIEEMKERAKKLLMKKLDGYLARERTNVPDKLEPSDEMPDADVPSRHVDMDMWDTDEAQEEWERWYSQMPPRIQKVIEEQGLTMTKKYAFASDPYRASYFRLAKVTVCTDADSEEGTDYHLHLLMLAFTSYDEVIGAATEADPEDLVEYPYDDVSDIPQERLEAEMRLVQRVSTIEDQLMNGVEQSSSYLFLDKPEEAEAETDADDALLDDDDEGMAH